jgi:CheY-like chemotaxis protein
MCFAAPLTHPVGAIQAAGDCGDCGDCGDFGRACALPGEECFLSNCIEIARFPLTSVVAKKRLWHILNSLKDFQFTKEGAIMSEKNNHVVLVVDDDRLARSVIVSMLELKGYTIKEANNTHEALDFLRSREHVDLLVTDFHMPGNLNGEQFVKLARSLRPGLKVLYATGYADALRQNAADNADTQILAKPFQLNVLLGKVGTMIAG